MHVQTGSGFSMCTYTLPTLYTLTLLLESYLSLLRHCRALNRCLSSFWQNVCLVVSGQSIHLHVILLRFVFCPFLAHFLSKQITNGDHETWTGERQINYLSQESALWFHPLVSDIVSVILKGGHPNLSCHYLPQKVVSDHMGPLMYFRQSQI